MDYYNKEELELLKNIITSPTYKLAEDDKEFLKLYETRGVRLELDYLKAEIGMRRFGIEHTIAIFGSARTLPQDVAKRRVDELIEKNINGIELKRATIALNNSYYYEDARELGRIIGKSGKGVDDNRVMVMTGGGPGIMEAANRGAFEVGAKSIGLNIKLPFEQHPNPYITPELCFLFHYFAIRKFHFFQRAKAMVVYPGGFGTMDELFELLTLKQTNSMKQIPVVLVGKQWWKNFLNIEFLLDEGMISKEDLDIFEVVDSAKDAWEYIINWHQQNRTPLFSEDESKGF
ncbi:MAG: TIGR00730 family Rossman fold protein [Epsilonproteobacteria bacterium]|nr:TIGR00730 family Rossman fold protein [Campylobacterota bacterium]